MASRPGRHKDDPRRVHPRATRRGHTAVCRRVWLCELASRVADARKPHGGVATRARRTRTVSGYSVNQAIVVDAADAVFAALADPTRRRVLQLVAERGPTSATLLERELPVPRQAIVKHLAVLHRAGLVSGKRTGQAVRYA